MAEGTDRRHGAPWGNHISHALCWGVEILVEQSAKSKSESTCLSRGAHASPKPDSSGQLPHRLPTLVGQEGRVCPQAGLWTSRSTPREPHSSGSLCIIPLSRF